MAVAVAVARASLISGVAVGEGLAVRVGVAVGRSAFVIGGFGGSSANGPCKQ